MRSAVVKVAKDHVKELGGKAVFKNLIHEGGDFVVQYFESVIFPAPPAVSSTRPQSVSSTYDHFPVQIHRACFPHVFDEPMQFGSYPMPMTPSDLGSDHDSPYCSPRPPPRIEPVFTSAHSSAPNERTRTTPGRRRAQNRVAQRAFRERKEKHVRDLKAQLSVLTDKYTKLEFSHTDLNAAYEKLRKTIELLTQNDDAEGEDDKSKTTRRRSSNSDTLRKLLEILHGSSKISRQ
ncbi:hypothetical protein HBI23_245950 [Parastagonospora nodorum]|nr:hypothetical protein HBI23_245950 [Parastagonospora nodorum]KAH5622340.1 hypothetical protein HBI51_246160 [Parastagonospora nodorum]KAH5983723.1 hypothetical protein HBI84_244680 [Parastagonospora nodorum]KAH6134221.1 hypothetical protein HBI68_247170 [Parastagonospora nodorum]KAH6380596.1 hypothetical protein HBI08_234770 [Parastagonospora nodorum]